MSVLTNILVVIALYNIIACINEFREYNAVSHEDLFATLILGLPLHCAAYIRWSIRLLKLKGRKP